MAPKFSVVALGVGTKFLRAAQISPTAAPAASCATATPKCSRAARFKRFCAPSCAAASRTAATDCCGRRPIPAAALAWPTAWTFHPYFVVAAARQRLGAAVRVAGAVHAELLDTELLPAPQRAAAAAAPRARGRGTRAAAASLATAAARTAAPRTAAATTRWCAPRARARSRRARAWCSRAPTRLRAGTRWARRARCSRTFCRRSTSRRSPSAAALRAPTASVRSAAGCRTLRRRRSPRCRPAMACATRRCSAPRSSRPRRDQHGGRRGFPRRLLGGALLAPGRRATRRPRCSTPPPGSAAGGGRRACGASPARGVTVRQCPDATNCARAACLAPASLPEEEEDATTKRDLEDAEYRRARELLHSARLLRRVGPAYVHVRRDRVDTL